MEQNKVDVIMQKIIKEARLIPDERFCVLYFNNLGDWYSLCTSVKYAEEKLGKRAVLLYHQEKQKEVAEWFSYDGYEIELYHLPKDEYNFLLKNNKKDDLLVKKYTSYILTWYTPQNDFVKMTRNIDAEFRKVELRKPRLPEFCADKYIKKYGVKKNNTVIMNPESNSVKTFPDWFWNIGARFYENLGFKVFFNVSESDAKRFVCQSIMPPLHEMVGLLDYCGYFISVRTGLVDVVSTSKAKMTIYSTDFYDPIDNVFGIDNTDGRIRTIYYRKNDYLLEKTPPISYAYESFAKEKDSLNSIINSMSEIIKDDVSENELFSPNIEAYLFTRYSYRMNRWKSLKTDEFLELKCRFAIKNDLLYFEVDKFDINQYRIDIEIFCDKTEICRLNDYGSNILVYKLNLKGFYYVKARIIDKKDFKFGHFTSKKIGFGYTTPLKTEDLRACDELTYYVSALEKFKDDIYVFISTNDTHTCENNKNNLTDLTCLDRLGVRSDLLNTYRNSFLAVIESGNVVYEAVSECEELSYDGELGKIKYVLRSIGFNVYNNVKTCISEIKLDNKEYAVNSRGLNIVVWDKNNNALIDSVTFDVFSNKVYRLYKNVSIVGDRVSGDIFSKRQKKCIIDRYVSFSNPLAFFSKCEKKRSMGELKEFDGNDFSKRCHVIDFNKNTFDYLSEKQSDWLIFDISDVRMNMLSQGDNYFTMSDFITRNSDILREKYGEYTCIEVIDADGNLLISEEECIKKIEEYCDEVLRIYTPEKIILNELYMVTHYKTKGGDAKLFRDISRIEATNRLLKKLYKVCEKKLQGCYFVKMPEYIFATEKPIEGVYASRYNDIYYDYAFEAFSYIFDNNGKYSFSELQKCIDECRNYYSVKAREEFLKLIESGMVKKKFGTWTYFKHDYPDYSYTGLAMSEKMNYVFVKEGVYDGSFEGVAHYDKGGWMYVKEGRWDRSFTGVAQSTKGNYVFVKHGRYNEKFTGVAKTVTGDWLFIKRGRYNEKFTGVARSVNGNWIFVKNGRFDKTYTGAAVSTKGNILFVKNGRWDKKFSGNAQGLGDDIIYFKEGRFDKSYTGVATVFGSEMKCYVKNGVWDKNYSGKTNGFIIEQGYVIDYE